MSWGSDYLGITEESFNAIKSAGIDSTTGIAGFTMDDLISFVPVDTPFFDSTPRRPSRQGARQSVWQALLNVNTTQPDGGIAAGYSAPVIDISNQYMSAPFAVLGAGGKVTWDAEAQAQGYADVLAVDTLQAINQLLISMEIHQLNALSFALPSAGTVTLSASTSGGSIPASTAVYVKCAPRSGVNWYRGGSAAASSEVHVTTGSATSTNSVTASVAAVKCAAGYDWYVGASSGAEYYYTTTAVNTVTITAVPTATQNVPTGLAGLYNAGQPGPSAVPTSDASYQTYWQNGLYPSILGDFSVAGGGPIDASNAVANLVTPGSGTSQGAYYKSLDGGQLTVSGAAFEQIDDMNRSIYDAYQITPSRMLVGSQVINDISNGVLNNPQAVTWLVPTDKEGRAQVVAGGHVANYLNKTVNGVPIELHLMPYLPPGKIISVVDEVPFPGANITTTIDVETLYDFFRFDYGANRQSGTADGGPRYDFEVRSEQTLRVKASPLMGVIDNIAPGLS